MDCIINEVEQCLRETWAVGEYGEAIADVGFGDPIPRCHCRDLGNDLIDVLATFLSGRVDAHRDQDTRGALARMAEAERWCVVAIGQLNKSAGGKALYRGGGSIGIVGAARVGLIAGTDPDDADRRILAVTKSNLAPPCESLAYGVVVAPEHGCGRIH